MPWIWDIVLIVLVLALYSPALKGQFTWDDWRMVRDNEALRSFGGLGRIWFKPANFTDYYPLTYSSLWLEYRIFGLPQAGEPPWGYHLTNMLLHGACAIALRRLLVRLAVPGAAVAALIFAAHPVFVESVAWIAERKNVLSGVFYLTAAIAFLRFIESEGRSSAKWWYLASLGLFALALLSKSPAIILPVMLLLVCWWRQKRDTPPPQTASPDAPEEMSAPANLSRRFFQLLPFFALAALSAGMTIWMENFVHKKLVNPMPWSLGQRAALAGQVPWFYLGKLLLPLNLLIIYPQWNVDATRILGYAGLAGILLILLLLWVLRHRLGRGPVVGWMHYILALAPVMGFINIDYFRFSPVADHFQYLAAMGMIALLVGMVAAGLRQLVPERRRVIWAAAPVTALLVLVLSGLTFARAGLFGEVESLWTQTLQHNPHSWMARLVLTQHQLEAKRIKPAIHVLEEGLKRDPDNAEVHEQLAHLYYAQNDIEQALEHMSRGTRGRAVVGQLYSDYAVMQLQAGDYRTAESMLRKGLAAKNDPQIQAIIQANLASLLATCPDPRVANPAEALSLARELVAEPENRTPQNLILLAICYAAAGQRDAAITAISEAAAKARNSGDTRMLQSIERTRFQLEQAQPGSAAPLPEMQPRAAPAPAPATQPATVPSTNPVSP